MNWLPDLDEIDTTMVDAVGGKGANLGELTRVDGVRVPDGFCVTTDAFRTVLADAPVHALLDALAGLAPADRDAIATTSARVRAQIEAAPVPVALAARIGARVDEHTAYAVRSSATAEDLPSASFAGQHDSYLDVTGADAVVEHVRRCWASLFTDRAVSYRLHNGIDHRAVHMGVVVQRMVHPDAAGVLFTADPITSNRTVATVESVRGPGESLVSGLVNAEVHTVRHGRVVTRPAAVEPVLTDAQVLELVRIGRRVEAHFGHPQDIEWCLVGDEVDIVQSRPITTLFPVPQTDDDAPHVYLSVGHQQMMTDAMKPLGLSMWHLTTPAVMVEAGSRLFVDVAGQLASPSARRALLDVVGRGDPLFGDALQTVVDRGFVPTVPDTGPAPMRPATPPVEIDPDLVGELISAGRASLATLEREVRNLTGPALFEFLLTDFEEDKRLLFEPRSIQVVMAGMNATWWLNEHLSDWLGETNAADTLAQSAPHNVTSEMGLALLDVADVIRPYPEVVALLAGAGDDVLERLDAITGGPGSRAAMEAYLASYGMRCAGEIDITRPRWSEQPSTLVPAILGHVRGFAPGAAAARFDDGRRQAHDKEVELLARLRALPDGEQKAAATEPMIRRLRAFVGYREYPKYGKVCRAFVYKQALLREADRLVRAGVLDQREDVFHLRFEEFHAASRTLRVDADLIRRRREQFRRCETLTPPRVLTSEGEAVTGVYRRDDVPSGALPGLAVSAGTVEGRARVVHDIAHADLEPGDILVTAFTDPSWTPLFVTVAGLVTEVGGLMTHGAVIAREYGLPAVVGVPDATRLIRDGQWIRVHGTAGYVELVE